VDAGVAAEGPPGCLDHLAAPATDRLPRFIPHGFTPLIRSHCARATGAHAEAYRPLRSLSLQPRVTVEIVQKRHGPAKSRRLRPSPGEVRECCRSHPV
jgi:hypothetical protein